MTTPWIVAFTVLTGFSTFTFLVVLGMLRRVYPLLERAEQQLIMASSASAGGLPLGATIPDFSARREDGSPFSSADLVSGIILFLSAGCAPCRALASDLSARRLEHQFADVFVVLNEPAESAQFRLPTDFTLIYQQDRAVANAFQTTATPHAFVVRDGAIVAKGTPSSADGLLSLWTAGRGGEYTTDTGVAPAAALV